MLSLSKRALHAGQYNTAQPFPRPLGGVASSFTGRPHVEYTATSFGWVSNAATDQSTKPVLLS